MGKYMRSSRYRLAKVCFLWIAFALHASSSIAQEKNGGYIKLPNGVFAELPFGVSADAGMAMAREKYPEAFRSLSEHEIQDVDWFQSCKQKAAKEASNRDSLGVMIQACDYKSVPKKCRQFPIELDSFEDKLFIRGLERAKCVAACKSENYISRTVGDCSVG